MDSAIQKNSCIHNHITTGFRILNQPASKIWLELGSSVTNTLSLHLPYPTPYLGKASFSFPGIHSSHSSAWPQTLSLISLASCVCSSRLAFSSMTFSAHASRRPQNAHGTTELIKKSAPLTSLWTRENAYNISRNPENHFKSWKLPGFFDWLKCLKQERKTSLVSSQPTLASLARCSASFTVLDTLLSYFNEGRAILIISFCLKDLNRIL